MRPPRAAPAAGIWRRRGDRQSRVQIVLANEGLARWVTCPWWALLFAAAESECSIHRQRQVRAGRCVESSGVGLLFFFFFSRFEAQWANMGSWRGTDVHVGLQCMYCLALFTTTVTTRSY